MKKSVFSSIAVLVLISATHTFAQAPKAVDQLAAQAPQRQAVVPAAQPEITAVVYTENGKPVRTIYFETAVEKGNPIFDAIFGGQNNPGFPGQPGHPGQPGYPNHPGQPGHPGDQYGRMSCVATDTGWEEHWGGHGGGPSEMDACRECLNVHGSCRFTCSVQQFRCASQFNAAPAPVTPGQPQPPLPAPQTFNGDLRPDQGSAQDSAVLRCMQATQGQIGNCYVTGCKNEPQVVRRGTCRK